MWQKGSKRHSSLEFVCIYLCNLLIINNSLYTLSLNSYKITCLLLLIVILQQPFQIRSLIKYLPCKLRVGDNPPFPIVLQGTGTDIQPLTHFLACQEMFARKEWLVRLCHFHDPFPHTSQCRGDQLHLVRLHIQISYQFYNLRVYFNVSSTNSEQCRLCVNGPLYIDARLLWKQVIGSNCP